MSHSRLISLAVLAATLSPNARAEEVFREVPRLPVPPKTEWTIAVSPTPIRLTAANRRQQIVVTVRKDGRDVDVTRDATIEMVSTEVATVTGSVITAKKDGKTGLKVRYGKMDWEVLVEVENASSFPPVHFVNDIVPLFSKLGCNSGGCHGKVSGQNGFKLSVFGFDPHADFASLSRESRGRRIFTGDPERSLLILKAIGASAHGGGRRCVPGSADHELLSNWIRQGMPWGNDSAPTVQSVRVFPTSRLLDKSADQQLLVTAVYSDGSTRDVTDAASYSTNSPVIADVVPGGLVYTGVVPGPAAITVNYMGQVAAAKIIVPQELSDGEFPATPVGNPIDGLVWSDLKKLGILPSERCDDSTFLRRTSLRVLGRLPSVKEVRSFLADDKPDKRSRKIDELLSRDGFADYQALRWADILLVDRRLLGERCLRVSPVAAETDGQKPAVRRVGARAAHRNGRFRQVRTGQFLPGDADAGRTHPRRQPGVPWRANGLCPVPSPPVRKVGPGRFLWNGRILQRPAAEEAVGLARADLPRRLQANKNATNRGLGRDATARWRADRHDRRRPARPAGRVDDLAREPDVCATCRKPLVEAVYRPSTR